MLKTRTRSGIFALTVIFVALFMIILPAQAATELRITNNNLNALANPAYGLQWEMYRTNPMHEYLLYSSTVNLDSVKKEQVNIKRISPGVGYIGATKVNEVSSRPLSQANLDGQCVAFVKSMTNTPNIGTWSWQKGRPVVITQNGKKVVDSTITIGTAIATFDSYGKYSGHTAIYGNPSSTGLNVWDQNFRYDKAVARHCISYTGSTKESNINYYYVVNI